MPRQIQGSQNDFSFGEVDPDLKRSDSHPARKGGLRQMSNARIHNSGTIQNRSGKSALFLAWTSARIEELTMTPGNDFKLLFGAGEIRVFNSAGTQVQIFITQGSGIALPWTALNTNQIVYAVLGLNIYLTFGFAMRPQVITWDGVATWTIADYNEAIIGSGQKRSPFYRLSPQNVTMKPSAISGAITLQFSSPILVAAMNGTRMRFCGRQVLLGAMIDASNINAVVIEPLPPGQSIGITASVGNIAIGDVVIGSVSGAQGIVVTAPTNQSIGIVGTAPPVGTALTGGTSGATGIITAINSAGAITISLNTSTAFVVGETVNYSGGSFTTTAVSALALVVQLISTVTTIKFFTTSDQIVGPSGLGTVNAVTTVAPQAVSVWDDEVMNGFRGFPASVFVDQFRLGFCDWPAIPGGIAWSAINSPTDTYVGTLPSSGMFEIAPNKVRVYYVVPGPEGSEFVICDKRVYYIPINETNPLRPGSVAFKTLTGDGAARVRPHIAQEAILYVNAGGSTINAIIATGAYLRPFNTKSLTDFHAHLFRNIQCIAAPNADGQFNERYAYVLNGDGTIAVGKYNPESLAGNAPVVGWGPWSGAGAVKWIHAWGQDVLFTTSYFGATVCEILDDSVYMDASLLVNALPAPFTPPGGKGPLWWIPNQSVFLMDQVSRPMGVYQIDGNGFIVPQNNGGENLASASLVAGQIWSGAAEPFSPDATSGADMKQRMELRQYSKYAVYVIHSTGLVFASLFSGKQTRTSKVPGAIEQTCRVPAYNMDDDTTLPPFQRETSESWTPVGSSFDPRVAVLWDTPGPIQILEFALEIST